MARVSRFHFRAEFEFLLKICMPALMVRSSRRQFSSSAGVKRLSSVGTERTQVMFPSARPRTMSTCLFTGFPTIEPVHARLIPRHLTAHLMLIVPTMTIRRISTVTIRNDLISFDRKGKNNVLICSSL